MHKAEVRQLRFGCGASLQSAFIAQRRHWREGVTAAEKTELLTVPVKRNRHGNSKG